MFLSQQRRRSYHCFMSTICFILIIVYLKILSICLLVNSLNYNLVSQSRNKIRNLNLVEFPVKTRIRHIPSADPIFRNFEQCRLKSSLSEVLSFQFYSMVFVFSPTQASKGPRLPRDVVQEATEGAQGLHESHRSGSVTNKEGANRVSSLDQRLSKMSSGAHSEPATGTTSRHSKGISHESTAGFDGPTKQFVWIFRRCPGVVLRSKQDECTVRWRCVRRRTIDRGHEKEDHRIGAEFVCASRRHPDADQSNGCPLDDGSDEDDGTFQQSAAAAATDGSVDATVVRSHAAAAATTTTTKTNGGVVPRQPTQKTKTRCKGETSAGLVKIKTIGRVTMLQCVWYLLTFF